MRILSPLLVSLVISAISLSAKADDPLFSEIPMDAVFASASVDSDQSPAVVTSLETSRIMGIASLARTLKAGGFEPQKNGQHATIKVQYGVQEFEFRISVDAESDLLRLELPVRRVTPADPLSLDQMTELLAASDIDRPLHFAYNKAAAEIRVRFQMSSRDATAQRLKATIKSIAAFADENADAWKSTVSQSATDATSNSPSVAAVTPPAVPATDTPVSSNSLIGMWSANLNAGQAFAIQISEDSTFQLVQISNGKSTISKGKVSLAGNRLTLAGEDNVTLTGNLATVTSDGFQLNITTANGKVALTLNFKKAK